MPTRYQQLRQTVAILASPPEQQVQYLDEIFTSLTRGGSVAGYGNDELALELDDIFSTANDMIEHGELTQPEKEAIQPLNELLDRWSGEHNSDFWEREALFQDQRWARVRSRAAQALVKLPDEERAVDRSA